MTRLVPTLLILAALTTVSGDPTEVPGIPDPHRSLSEQNLVVTVTIDPRQTPCDGCAPLPPTGSTLSAALLLGAAASTSIALGAGAIVIQRRLGRLSQG